MAVAEPAAEPVSAPPAEPAAEPAPTPPTEPAPGPASARGEALVHELKWVHDMLRADLRILAQLAVDTGAGQPAWQIQAGLALLAARSPLWQLKINCLQYCHFVHSHHQLESMALFPGLRRVNPALNPVVDQLEADHLRISGQLTEVEAAAGALGEADDPAARAHLIQALQRLSDDLLAHLAYEEAEISGTLRTLSSWPLR